MKPIADCTIVAFFAGQLVAASGDARDQLKGESAKISHGVVVGALESEFQGEAAECAAAKTDAKTDAEFDRTMTNLSIHCND